MSDVDFKVDRDSRFLYAEDFCVKGTWKDVTLRIQDVHNKGTLSSSDKKPIDKFVLAFHETEKLLILNDTNVRLIIALLQSKSASDWRDKQVTFYPACGPAFGEQNVPWIRVRMPAGSLIPFGVRRHLGRDLTSEGKK